MSEFPSLGQRYQPLRWLSRRSFSSSLAARDRQTGNSVFLKILNADRKHDSKSIERFLLEPAVLGWLSDHVEPCPVVRLLEMGRIDGRPYFTQPLMPGWSLAEAMRTRPLFQPRSVLRVIQQTLQRLQAIHGAGFVHGDISPENIFVATDRDRAAPGTVPPDAEISLIDFELARRINSRANQPGGVVAGKPGYCAPECAADGVLSVKSDLYALGIVFFELMVGRRPYEAKSWEAVRSLNSGSVETVPLATGVPEPVEELVYGLVSHDPSRRTASASDALSQVHQLLHFHHWVSADQPVEMLQVERRPIGSSADLRRETSSGMSDADLALQQAVRETEETTEHLQSTVSYLSPPQPKPIRQRDELLTDAGVDEGDDQRRDLAVPYLPPAFTVDEKLRRGPQATPPPEGGGSGDDGLPTASEAIVPEGARLDENVQFTVYRPSSILPKKWYTLLAFAHLSERPHDAAADEADPLEEVERQANELLQRSDASYEPVRQDSRSAVPRSGELVFTPDIPGIEFNPRSKAFRWMESVHREDFRLRANAGLDGKTARGRLLVHLGCILIADLNLAIRVDSAYRTNREEETTKSEPLHSRPYRKIFASYSHLDLEIVKQVEQYAKLMGDEYVRDWTHLRVGEQWNARLRDLIREADVFQLFWSWNSMRSDYVRQEYEYALSLTRPHFVRPTYWQLPMPTSQELDLPPTRLRELHFERIAIGADQSNVGKYESPQGLGQGAMGSAGALSPECSPSGLAAYEHERALGQGGFGSINKATHRTLGHPVIIKRFDASKSAERFEEIQSTNGLNHPHVVPIIDAGMDRGQLFIVRPYFEIDSLSAMLRIREFTVQSTVAICIKYAEALHFAHERGLVHSDLASHNAFLDQQEMPYLMADHFVSTSGPFMNKDPGLIYGTPAYMPPERFEGAANHNRRSDVYSLAVILYEMLTRSVPFPLKGRDFNALMQQVLHQLPPPLSRANADVPDKVAAVCLKGLEKDPADRFPTASDFAAQLRQASI